MKRIINCRVCGKEFEATNGNAKICPKCRPEYDKQRRKERLERDKQLRESRRPMLYCIVCGKELGTTPGLKYCSLECKQTHYRNLKQQNKPIVKCEICGRQIERGKFCSECRPGSKLATVRRPNLFGSFDNFCTWAKAQLRGVDLSKYGLNKEKED